MRSAGSMSFTGGKLKLKGGNQLGVTGSKKKKKHKKTEADASAIVLAADSAADNKVGTEGMFHIASTPTRQL